MPPLLELLLIIHLLFNSIINGQNETNFSQNEFLIYRYPSQPVINPNFTIAAMFPVNLNGTELDYVAASNLMTSICEIYKYNKGIGNYSVKGTFNVIAYASYSLEESNAYILLREVLGQNLYYSNSTTTTFGKIKNTPVNSVIRQSSLMSLGLDLGIISGVGLPSIEYVFNGIEDGFGNTVVRVPNSKSVAGSVLISQASAYVITAYMFVVFKHYNWTLVGAVFSAGLIGFLGQDAFQNSATLDNRLTVACTGVIDNPHSKTFSQDLDNFCSCVSSINILNVIVIWTDPKMAVNTTKSIISKIGSKRKDLVFIYPGIADQNDLEEIPISSIFFQKIIDTKNSTTDPLECSPQARTEMISVLGKANYDEITIKLGNCLLSDPELPICDKGRAQGDYNCHCLNDQIYFSPFAADGVSLLMKSIYNMQTDCKNLNLCVQKNYREHPTDYCSITEFNGWDLYYATKCTELFGYSGFISFNNQTNLRNSIPVYVKQIQENNNPAIIATFEENITFYDNQYFSSGNVPESAILIDDPDLTYGFMVFFFSIDIVLIVITVALLIFVIVKRKHRIIRRSGVVSLVTILLGILWIEASEIIMVLKITETTCKLIDMFYLIGVSFIISTLVAKLYRIYRIFQNPTAQAVLISDKDLGIFTFIICFGSIFLFILYTTLGGGLQPITKTAELDPFYVFNICEIPKTTFQTGFLIAFYVYFVSIFVAAGLLAFITRKTLREFNESSNIGSVVYCWIGIAIIYAPIYYLQGNSTNSNQTRYIIRYIAMDLAIIQTLSILYWGKISDVIRSEKRAHKRRRSNINERPTSTMSSYREFDSTQ